jgi:hypothetical protein
LPPAASIKNPQFRGFFAAGNIDHSAFPAEIPGLAGG